MATTRRSLGRGLSALIPDNDMDFLSRVARGEPIESGVPGSTDRQGSGGFQADSIDSQSDHQGQSERAESAVQIAEWVDPKAIEVNPYQPRRVFGSQEMQELVASIREHGILQPILIRPSPSGAEHKPFQLVAGERRWRAACDAGLERIPAIIRELSEQQSLELALIENVQRHDISALDAAIAFKRLAQEFHLTQIDIARRVGKSRSSVANTVRLLELPDEVQKALDDGVLSEGHGRAILGAPGEGSQRAIFRRILRDKLSVREVERLARQAAESDSEGSDNALGKSDSARHRDRNSAEYLNMARAIQRSVGAPVAVRSRAKGGHIVIRCATQAEIERIAKLLTDVGG